MVFSLPCTGRTPLDLYWDLFAGYVLFPHTMEYNDSIMYSDHWSFFHVFLKRTLLRDFFHENKLL